MSGLFLTLRPAEAAIGGKRAGILSPFKADARAGSESPHDHAGTYGGYGFAWDVHGGANQPVYPRFQTGDGALALKVVNVGTLNGAGEYVDVQVKVSGTVVGKLSYVHLKNVQVDTNGNETDGKKTNLTTNDILGYTAKNEEVGAPVNGKQGIGFAWNEDLWQVTSSAGIHVHVKFMKACYSAAIATNETISPTKGMGLLSENYGDAHKDTCDSDELHDVLTGTTNTLPVSSFTIPINDNELIVGVDGSGSSDPDGTVTSYHWNFGDGKTATGQKVTHQYTSQDTFVITLTVTDNNGAQKSTSHSVSVRTGQLAGDVTGGGTADAVTYYPDGTWYVAPSNGTGFVKESTPWITGFGAGSTRQMLAKVNNDDIADAVAYYPDGRWYVALSNGTSFVKNTATWLWVTGFGSGSTRQMLANVDNDGKADAVAYFPNGNWYVAPSNGTSFVKNSSTWLWTTGFGTDSTRQMLADVTGGGKADAVAVYPDGRWYVAPSTGTIFEKNASWLWLTGFGTQLAYQGLADVVNNDGKADAVAAYSNGEWFVAPSSGTNFVSNPNTWQWASGFGSTNLLRPMLADVTGAGGADAIVFYAGNGYWYVAPTNGSTSFLTNPNSWLWATSFGQDS